MSALTTHWQVSSSRDVPNLLPSGPVGAVTKAPLTESQTSSDTDAHGAESKPARRSVSPPDRSLTSSLQQSSTLWNVACPSWTEPSEALFLRTPSWSDQNHAAQARSKSPERISPGNRPALLAFTPAAKGQDTPEESSAQPLMAYARPGRLSLNSPGLNKVISHSIPTDDDRE